MSTFKVNKCGSNIYPLIFFFLFQLTDFPQSNTVKFESFTVSDGLPDNSGLCMLQDQKGFLWIGTQSGLYRYDGYTIKKFQNIPGDSSSLPGNFINSVYLDHTGTIWVGTEDIGVFRHNSTSRNFKVYKNDPSDPFSLNDNHITSVFEDSKGNLWVGTK